MRQCLGFAQDHDKRLVLLVLQSSFPTWLQRWLRFGSGLAHRPRESWHRDEIIGKRSLKNEKLPVGSEAGVVSAGFLETAGFLNPDFSANGLTRNPWETVAPGGVPRCSVR